MYSNYANQPFFENHIQQIYPEEVPQYYADQNVETVEPTADEIIENFTVLPEVSLKNLREWLQFDQQVNEMVFSNTGKELCPKTDFSILNLDPSKNYQFGMKLLLNDRNFMQSKQGIWTRSWKSANAAPESNEIFTKVQTGGYWIANGVLFEKAKIYNIGNENKKRVTKENSDSKPKEINSETMMLVTSMCEYVIALTGYEIIDDEYCQTFGPVVFDQTKFVAVSNYRNKKVSEMKSHLQKHSRKEFKADVPSPAVVEEQQQEEEPKIVDQGVVLGPFDMEEQQLNNPSLLLLEDSEEFGFWYEPDAQPDAQPDPDFTYL